MTAKSLKHKFQSAIADQGTAGEVSPNDWNDDHDLRLGGRTVTGTTDTIVTSDELSLLKYNNATGVAVALAAPGGADFPSGWTTFLRNAGAGAITITVTGATVNGASTLVIVSGNGAILFSDGGNYDAIVLVSTAGDATAPQGRLTLQAATPVMTTTQAAMTTIYYSPYQGNLVPIYSGTSFAMTTFAELSVATTDTTKSPAAIGASKVNDWFVWSDAGTLRIGHGPDWTNDTTPVGSGSRPGLTNVFGIWTNQAVITNGPAINRGTYVGTTRSNASSQLDWIYGTIASTGGPGFLGVWNAYNRVNVASMVGDSDSSASFGATTLTNYPVNMKHTFVCGLAEDAFEFIYNAIGSPGAGYISLCIGYDSTTVMSGTSGYTPSDASGFSRPMVASYATTALGCHVANTLVATPGGGTGAVGGNLGAAGFVQTGFWFKGKM